MSSTYIDGTTPLDASHLNALQQKAEKGVANGYPSLDSGGKVPLAQLPSLYSAPSYGTTLPASPVDGQEAILVDSTSNPTYQWQFRYNAGSSSAYKWEFVGGPPVYVNVDTDENTASGSYVALTTPGPSITVSRAGDYLVRVLALISTAVANNDCYMSFDVGGTAASDTNAAHLYSAAGGNTIASISNESRITGVAAATAFVAKYHTNAVGSAHFAYRKLIIIPVRVA